MNQASQYIKALCNVYGIFDTSILVVHVCLQENIVSRLSTKPSPSLPANVSDDETNESQLSVSRHISASVSLCLSLSFSISLSL